MKKASYYLLISLIIITGCDFRLPQDWENPSWNLPLSLPLFNDSITIGQMINTGYNCYGVQSIDENYIYETLADCQADCVNQEDVDYGCKTISYNLSKRMGI